MQLTQALRDEYDKLFSACAIRPDRAAVVESTVQALLGSKDRYTAVADQAGVPWQIVAVIHNMEGSRNFSTHLHNGDPLDARTRHEPPNRPASGSPPFTWEESAVDALRLKNMHKWTDWTVPGSLFKLEGYNGWGYRRHHPHVLTPYLWSHSNHYASGKYVADGRFSDTAVSQQTGAAVLLRRLAERNEIAFAADPGIILPAADAPALRYAPDAPSEDGRRLQAFLNTFPGVHVKEDGYLGPRTSEALRKVTGSRLHGDPQEG